MKKFISLLFCIFLCSCVAKHNYRIQIDALSSGENNTGIKYVMMPLDYKNIQSSDLQFKEFSGQVENILREKGMIRVYDGNEADAMILLGYRISSKDVQNTYSSPIYGQTGISTSTTYGNTTYHTPSFGVTGYATNTYTDTRYTRSLFLAARKLDKGNLGDELWRIHAGSSGSSGDLRAVFPAMITAIRDYVTSNSQKQITVIIDVENPSMIISKE